MLVVVEKLLRFLEWLKSRRCLVKKEFEIFINPLLQFFGGMAYSILAFLALVKKNQTSVFFRLS